MTTNNSTYQHPFDLLEAFALDALEPAEEQAVADHVERCETCSEIVEDNWRVLGAMAESIPAVAPPAGLRSRVMDSIDPHPWRNTKGIGIQTSPSP